MSGLDGAVLDQFTQGINAPEGPADAGKIARVNAEGDNLEYVTPEEALVGAAGLQPAAFHYKFSADVDEGAPGSGFFRCNTGGGGEGGSQSVATRLFVSPEDADGRDWSEFFTLLRGAFLRITALDGSGWLTFAVTNVESAFGYIRLTTSEVQKSDLDPFADGADVVLAFDAARIGTVPVITGSSTQEQLDSLIAALVTLRMVSDGRFT